MNISKVVKMLVLSLSLMSVLSACAPSRIKHAEVSCNSVSDKNLQTAFESAKGILSQRMCHYEFDALHQQLLSIAKNDPAEGTGLKFLQFYKWNVSEGVISSKQGKNLYNRYFKSTFGHILPNNQNVCSLRGNKDPLIKELGRELGYKKMGLQEAMQDRDAYFEAQRIHNELVFLLETTLMACSNS